MLAIINAYLLVFSSHLYVVISFISHVLCLQPLFSVVPMNSSFSPFLKPQIAVLKGGKSLGLEVRVKDGSLRLVEGEILKTLLRWSGLDVEPKRRSSKT